MLGLRSGKREIGVQGLRFGNVYLEPVIFCSYDSEGLNTVCFCLFLFGLLFYSILMNLSSCSLPCVYVCMPACT